MTKISLSHIPLLLCFILSSCISEKYLPQVNEIGINPYGSYINVKTLTGPRIKGELIAVDSFRLLILTSDSGQRKKLAFTRISDVKRFKLSYAKSKRYGATIPAGIALPLIPFSDPSGGGTMPFHGAFSLLSIPVNLIVTISVTATGVSAFQYNKKEMSYEKLTIFARFPQGIPKTIDIETWMQN